MKKLMPAVWLLLIFLSVSIIATVDRQQTFASMNFGSTKFSLQIADTEHKRQIGLSGQTSLPRNGGMVFVFERPEAVCFWMRDMRFDLDIIWLDSDKKIIKIAEAISPNTYPQSFCPGGLAKYVVELNSGVTRQLGMAFGQSLPIKL